jgi:hypothetical protein
MRHLQIHKQKLWQRKNSWVGLAIGWHPQRSLQACGDSAVHRDAIPFPATNIKAGLRNCKKLRHVCLSVYMKQLDTQWTNFHEISYLRISGKSVAKIQASLKYDKNDEYCIVFLALYCTVLYYIVLYRIVFYCILSYGTVLYRIALYCIVSYCIVLYRIILYRTVLYCIVSYGIVFIV